MRLVSAMLVTALALTPSLAIGQATAPQMTVLAQSSEYRFQLDFHVNDAVLAKMLPAGWVSNMAAQGPAKDANIRLIFIDAGNITGPDGKLLGKGRDLLVYVAAPVKQANGPGLGQMILTGISQNNPDAAFGVLDKGGIAKATRTIAMQNDKTVVTEDWEFAAANSAHAALHVKFQSAPANRSASTTSFYNPTDSGMFQLFRTELATDIARNLTTNPPDRVLEFSYKAGGGKFAALFDGSEKALSWDSQPGYSRTIGTPTQ